MADNTFPQSDLPIRRTVDLLPKVFQTDTNDKFLSGVVDPLVQPGVLQKTVGYVGRRYGKTYNSEDIYLDTDQTLRSRYQLEPGINIKHDGKTINFYDYIDFKNQLRFFGNEIDRDDLICDQDHYSWAPPIRWDKFVNFREYYWVPDGPPPVKILGQAQNVTSTYKVKLGVGSTFIFSPDGMTNNPTLTLYRGQTYKFVVNAPDNGFVIRTNYDKGSLLYNPNLPYAAGQLVIFNDKLWRAKTAIPVTDGSTINEESQDWEYVEPASAASAFDYNVGVTNNGIVQGTVTFTVPLNSPDVLYYQSYTDPNRFGRFILADVESNTKIDVEKEIIGKSTYTSSNGVELSNGMIVYFVGQVLPAKYATDTWLVEGVGSEIKLIRFQDLTPPSLSKNLPEVLFDNMGFDAEPFDDAITYPAEKDYIVIDRSSQDSNPWSRYNRWFHQSVLNYSHAFNGTDFDAADTARAKRPIIEFKSDLRLFNHGTKAKLPVDFVDTFTTDVFSTIEGSQGYIVDGEELFDGARILVTADTDVLANNKIYEVNFITHTGGQTVGVDWDPHKSYRNGERTRLNGLPYTAIVDLPAIKLDVISSNSTRRTFRVQKNAKLAVDMAVVFDDPVFGNVTPGQIYYIIEVNNSEANATEFKISVSKRGPEFKPTTGAFNDQYMNAYASVDPTNTSYWKLAFNVPQISLRKVSDTEPELNECVLIKRGAKNRGLMYHFDGSSWKMSQTKTSTNLSPMFDVFDENGVSFSDSSTYPVSTFSGSKILSYKVGNSVKDPELGFSLSYLNIDNVGDILFEFTWDTEKFFYENNKKSTVKSVATGFYQFNDSQEYGNCWVKTDRKYLQPIIETVTVEEQSLSVSIDAIKWSTVSDDKIFKVIPYINGQRYLGKFTRNIDTFTFDTTLNVGDVVSIKVFADAEPSSGYYEIPIGLEKNPLNTEITTFTIGQAIDHIASGIELFDEFSGQYPGTSNLRDLENYSNLCRRFVKHSGVTPVAMTMICDKQANIIKALEFAGRSYRDFKNNFIQLAETLDYGQNPVDFVDEIIAAMTAVKRSNDPFVNSDMIGAGAYSSLKYTVEDEGIKVFALSQKFSLSEPSSRAVYVYRNNQQLIVETEYSFNPLFGFVEILIDLVEGDRIEIREYVSTAFSYIPATPTSLGLYKKFTPEKFYDDTYIEPTEVIRGHDGSITVAFGDYRDDVILELEKRIYNNIKQEYSRSLFDIDNAFGGYYGNSVFTKEQQDSLVSRQFRKWAITSRSDFVENTYFDSENPWTYTYNKMTTADGSAKLPGWWKGIYQWLYDTVHPHLHPWEMLGFSQEPDWWKDQYGPAPYTSNNLILWEDLRDGIIRQGPRAGTYDRFKRPDLLDRIPVDGDGNLVDPLTSNVVGNFTLFGAKASFKFGDNSPVEYAWRSSSDWPFAVMIACCLARPFEFIIENLDKNNIKINILGQTVNPTTGVFSKASDIVLPESTNSSTSGLINYVADYLRSRNISFTVFDEKLKGIDVNLSTRLSGFVDPDQQKYILDSKNPRAKSSSIFVPRENYDIVFNTSVPIQTITYSAVIVEKVPTGFKVYGYDNIDPVFKHYGVFTTQSDPLLSVGGVSENFIEWAPNKVFSNGVIVKVRDSFYRAIRTHTSGDEFDLSIWRKLPGLPLVGAIEAYRRVHPNKSKVRELEYGTIFADLQSLVDFICGYEFYLQDQGFEFNEYDPDLSAPKNWTTSIKELMFWTKHKWADGALIALSPAANRVVLSTPVGVVENFLDGFYEYQILQVDGSVLPVEGINVNRKFKQIVVDTVDNTLGIFLFKVFLVLKEHVTIFSDRTVFNDVMYDKPTGYRQERIKSRGFRTVDWDGDYTSPGFIFDNVSIQTWQPFVDYKLGDIVSYRSHNWTSLVNQKGLSEFVDANWSRLDSTPTKQLVSNFDFKANLFEDYYNVDADGYGASQRDLARHAVGYQTREYLQDLAEDQVTQFKLFQGFIKEKGTANSIVKVFDKLSKTDKDSVTLKEEWAFKVGSLGGVDQLYQYEFDITKSGLKINPQPILVVSGAIGSSITDQYYRVNQSAFTYSPVPYTTSINPVKKYSGVTRNAGYVNANDVDIILKTRDDLLSLDIATVKENSHIWVIFDNHTWSVLRFNSTESLVIRELEKKDSLVTITLNRKHKFAVGDIVGIKDVIDLTGFYKIVDTSTVTFTVEIDPTLDPQFETSSLSYNICLLTEARLTTYQDLDLRSAALLRNGSKVWVDGNSEDSSKWQVAEKQSQYQAKNISQYLITSPVNIGSAVVYADSIKMSLVGVPGSDYVLSASEFPDRLEVRQIVAPVFEYEKFCNKSFGSSIAVSPDSVWLAVGAPFASGVISNYAGDWDELTTYYVGDIVLAQGSLWQAVQDLPAGGTLEDFNDSSKWVSATRVTANLAGRYHGPTNQGMVTMYRWKAGQWNSMDIVLSPRIDSNEFFGYKVALSVSAGKYYMAVSATGAVNRTGRVYLFECVNDTWMPVEDPNYRGVFDTTKVYNTGNIVWYNNNLWRAVSDVSGDGSTITIENSQWELIDPVSTQSSVPLNVSFINDGSTLPTGLTSIDQVVELVKQGDGFGSSLAVNRDGSIMVVGVPSGDAEYFANYKGLWDARQTYRTGDVVKYIDPAKNNAVSYRELFDPRSDNDVNTDSTLIYSVVGVDPSGDPWKEVGDSSIVITGKIFIYKKNTAGVYDLIQTITASNVESLNDTGSSASIASGDQFGYCVDIDLTGTTIVVSSPSADINFVSQGTVYVLKTDSVEAPHYRVKQVLQSYEEYPNEFFGSSVSISQRAERIAVGAKNAGYELQTTFDSGETIFDTNVTRIVEDIGAPGQVYVYEKKDQVYVLVEKLQDNLEDYESFGSAIDLSDSLVLVGSPDFRKTVTADLLVAGQLYVIRDPGTTDWMSIGSLSNLPGTTFTASGPTSGTGVAISTVKTGKVRMFKKDSSKDSWNVLAEETDLVDLDKIRNISIYDSINKVNLGSVDIVDHYKLKILGVAEQEIKFKTLYDPAIYTNGGEEQEVSESQAWFEKHVGMLWWDLSTAKFIYHEQSDLAYRIGNYNKLAPYASIDIYEWVESKYLPSQWAELADTTEGLALGISGQPMFADNSVLSVKILYNPTTGEATSTKYYFWVKNKTIIPVDVPGRRMAATEVRDLIENPEGSGVPYVSVIDADKFLAWNFDSLISAEKASFNIEYTKGYKQLNPVHREYQLLTEGVADSLPTDSLETKWIDSIVGYDRAGNKVPDVKLPEKQRYGLSFRPRQSMFVNRYPVLDSLIDRVNVILASRAFADTIDYTNFNLVDPVPSEVLNEYDTIVDTTLDLQNVGTNRVKRAILTANLVNGEVDTITIVDPGFGYKVIPPIVIEGDGVGATATATLDNQGRISSVTVLTKGRKYASAVVKIRNFSVLVRQDETINNYWAIYAWDDQRKVFVKSKIQAYDTTKYWSFVDWYADGYSSTTRIVKEISSFYLEPTISVEVGSVIRVKEFGNGGWALLEKTAPTVGNIEGDYNLVGRENGTIKIDKQSFIPQDGIGFDSIATFDGNVYDFNPTEELRTLLYAIKNDILVEDLAVEWNKLFFSSVRYAFVQSPRVDWAFKTSFLNAEHNVGSLDQRPSYRNDNLESFRQYIEEVKPYRTTIREYMSKYSKVDASYTTVTDFDLPPFYSESYGRIIPASQDVAVLGSYPHKFWANNYGYSVISIEVSYSGAGYTEPPAVLIEGDGTGATAKAFISNGRVVAVEVVTQGSGYTRAPVVSLVGGNGAETTIAKAVAVIGHGVVRSFNVGVKFDRISKNGVLTNFRQTEEFVAGGFTASFDLKYAPSRDKSKIKVTKNNQVALDDEYTITLYKSETDSYSTLKGKLIFVVPPAAGTIVTVSYERNDQYLDSVNRIQKYYSPADGMKGKELPQLMTGIDFGGVQIQGTTFDVTGGWDALPWFTDNWDSVESNADFYYVADGSTVAVDLPLAPPAGQMLSIYIRRADIDGVRSRTVRIDDPFFNVYDGSTVQPNGKVVPAPEAVMPTFVGDGVTKVVDFTDPVLGTPYIFVNAGDTLIFRPFDSDGSVTINDPNIIDTKISGGTLSSVGGAYVTATGRTAEEIVLDGDKFISPDQVPAPEENVPGQVLESVSIKCYHGNVQASAPLQSSVYVGDGVTTTFNIGLEVFEKSSIQVYLDKVTVDDYELDFVENQIRLTSAPAINSVLEIISVGLGGVNLLDYREFVADGQTNLFLTGAIYSQTSAVLATVNGVEVDCVFYNSSDYTDSKDRAIVRLSVIPEYRQVVKLVSLGSRNDGVDVSKSLIRVNKQTIIFDGSTVRYPLDNFVNAATSSATSSMLVEVNGRQLNGPDTVRVIYSGTNNVLNLGQDPFTPSGTITFTDVKVYINNEIQPVITVYTFNITTKVLTVNPSYLKEGDEIKVVVDINSEYRVDGSDLVIAEFALPTLTAGDVIEATWFSEYPSFDIISDQYTGGQVVYPLKRVPVNGSYVWVYKGGQRLTKDKDFSVDKIRGTVQLNVESTVDEEVKIVEFGADQWTLPHTYEIFKDMLNVYHFKRFSKNSVKLAKDLKYYDNQIVVTDGSSLFVPNASKNVSGVVIINNERIEYLQKNGNVLSQLRRGSLGTAIAEVHPTDSYVVDSSASENIPYSEDQERVDFISDGSSSLIGPLGFVPAKAERLTWYRDTIPESFGPCDQIEVFAGGTRLRKNPIDIYDEDLGASSPAADKISEAEFSVDGENAYIRLTNPVPAGTRITVIRRLGRVWYDRGDNSASAGRTLRENTNPIVNFILQKSSIAPE